MKEIILVANGKGWSESPREGVSWGINHILMQRPVDMVFEIHDLKEKFARFDEGAHHVRAMKIAAKENIPYMVRSHDEPIPIHIRKVYPLETITKFFGTDLIGSSFDAMMAMAIYSGYESIKTYGFQMKRNATHDNQRESALFWIGQAMGRGIQMYWHKYKDNPEHSDMFLTRDGKVYGFDIPQRLWDYTNVI